MLGYVGVCWGMLGLKVGKKFCENKQTTRINNIKKFGEYNPAVFTTLNFLRKV
jgi:hypothetical protein